MVQFLSQHRRPAAQLRAEFRAALAEPSLLVAPGVFDGLSALVVAEAGFRAVYVSGGAVSRSTGLPDLGLLTFREMRDRIHEVVRSVNLPVIADADTGYGGIFNVMRTVEELEGTGVAALHLEDQADPKRCGHYERKVLIGPDEMCAKISAAVRARHDENLLVIARTDAVAVEGFDSALDRAERYRRAGADMLFVEALENRRQMEVTVERLPVPLLINMFAGGKTPLLSTEEVEALGFALMIVPSDLQRASLYAMREAAAALRSAGSTAQLADRMASFTDRDNLVGLPDFVRVEDEFALPPRDANGQPIGTQQKAVHA